MGFIDDYNAGLIGCFNCKYYDRGICQDELVASLKPIVRPNDICENHTEK